MRRAPYHRWYAGVVDGGPSDSLVWDHGNERHAVRHDLSKEEIDGMYDLGTWTIDEDPFFRSNQVRLIGPTPGGRLITVAVEWLPARRAYRPIASWDAEKAERRRWRRDFQQR